ncbi:MAG: SPOR domain-containing protein [Tannerella sp.]|jgi:cell division septation protein DedD|nr:SPOR domain-containing protein [Tannerella sp.]
MDRIIGHIEHLLLRHDCVIIPDFGGFVLQSVSAVYLGEEHSFFPERKEIVFNPTLTHNDGLLLESYMQSYSVDFNKAKQLVRKDVAEMKEYLDDYSELQLGKIGLFIKEEDRLIFIPGKNSDVQFSTRSYGLPVFHYLPLSARIPVMVSSVNAPSTGTGTGAETALPADAVKRGKNVIYSIPVTRTFLRMIAATAAAIFLFLFISTPVSDVNKASYSASFIPQEIMPKKTAEQIVSEALSIYNDLAYNNSISDKAGYVPESDMKAESVVSEKEKMLSPVNRSSSEIDGKAGVIMTESASPESMSSEKPAPVIVANTEKKAEATSASAKSASSKSSSAKSSSNNTGSVKYYVIIGSFNNKSQAQSYIKRLQGAETANAGILARDGRARVFAQIFATEEAAQAYLIKIRRNPKHEQAWIYKGW